MTFVKAVFITLTIIGAIASQESFDDDILITDNPLSDTIDDEFLFKKST